MQFGISISPLRTGFGPVLYDTDMGGLYEGLAAAGYDGVEVSLVTPEAFPPHSGQGHRCGQDEAAVQSIQTLRRCLGAAQAA